jgi:membrane associated rhomboid family serine protease
MAAATSTARERRAGFIAVAAMVALMWVTETVDVAAGGQLDAYGIEPRDPDGLVGIVTAPFLHVGFAHLIANTIPFAVLGAVIALGGAARVVIVTVVVGLVSGLGVWLIAPDTSIHLGASGLVFGYATYLLTRGLFTRSAMHLLLGVLILALFGAALLGGLVPRAGISWQGHLFGAVGGVLAARLLTRGGGRAARAAPAA